MQSGTPAGVEWDGKVVSMFVVDIHEKGERIPPQSKGNGFRPVANVRRQT
jgi:hypothetical protein